MQGSKFMVTNVQFATGSRTFAPNKNNLGASFILQLLAHFHNKYIFCSLLDQIDSGNFGPRSRMATGKKISFRGLWV